MQAAWYETSISLVYEGEIVGFAGLMGAGRTETTRRSSEWMKRERRNLCGRQAGEDQLSHGCNPKRSCSGSGGQKERTVLCTKLSIRQNLALPNLDLVCNSLGVINSKKKKRFARRR